MAPPVVVQKLSEPSHLEIYARKFTETYLHQGISTHMQQHPAEPSHHKPPLQQCQDFRQPSSTAKGKPAEIVKITLKWSWPWKLDGTLPIPCDCAQHPPRAAGSCGGRVIIKKSLCLNYTCDTQKKWLYHPPLPPWTDFLSVRAHWLVYSYIFVIHPGLITVTTHSNPTQREMWNLRLDENPC